jgi:membrane-anchored mycosin MYCP
VGAALATLAVLAAFAAPPAAAATAVPAGPEPPPVGTAAPDGEPPGPAAGIRAPARCEPPPPDASTEPLPVASRLQLAAAHAVATGRGQVIAVIDTGIAAHERLGGRLAGGGDYLTGGDGLDDCDGHGTAVAGLLAASPHPDDDLVGIAPQARLISIRQSSPSYTVAGADGTARAAGDTDSLAEAIVLAVRRGAGVINVSEAVCLSPERAASAGALLQAALRHAARADVLVVAAAGNTGVGDCTDGAGQVSLPGWYDEDLLAVGAVDPFDRAAAFTVPGPWVDLAAPGTGLRSLAVDGGLTSTGVEGTSFAAPWVAGLAALVRERFPELTARQVADRLVATARPAGGTDEAVGAGVIDPVAALTAEPAVLQPPVAADPVTAVLPGTAPAPPQPGGFAWPGWTALVPVGALVAAAAVAAAAVRGRPRPAAGR